MLVSEIISAAKQYTQIDGSVWFSDTEALRSVNRAYRDVYEKILDADNEYFIKEVDALVSAMTPVRDFTYDYSLPADWHRLRRIAAVLPVGDHVLGRTDPQGIGQYEGYRYYQDKLRLMFRAPYDTFRIEYYPTPTEYTALNQSIVYPPQLEPLILAYQMAIDITNAQNGDTSKHETEYIKLWNRFSHATARRDNLRYPRVANVYRSTFPGW